MTSQPLCFDRFFMLLAISIGTSSVAQGIGLLVGAAADVQVRNRYWCPLWIIANSAVHTRFGSLQLAVFLAPAATIPFLLFSGFFVNLSAIPAYMQWIPYISFMRYAFEGSLLAIYGFGRAQLNCSQPYCHFKFPTKFLEQFDMNHSVYLCSLLSLVAYFLIIRLGGYFVLKCKLRNLR